MKKSLAIIFVLIISVTSAYALNPEKKAKNNGCFACHSVKLKVLGPSFLDISKKYETNSANQQMLVNKIKKGGSGNWGDIPMMAHPNVTDDDLNLMVRWILDL